MVEINKSTKGEQEPPFQDDTSSSSCLFHLRVGTIDFLLDQATIHAFHSERLTHLIQEKCENKKNPNKTKETVISVDADPVSFSLLLHRIRFGSFPDWNHTNTQEKEALLSQADFWGIRPTIEKELTSLQQQEEPCSFPDRGGVDDAFPAFRSFYCHCPRHCGSQNSCMASFGEYNPYLVGCPCNNYGNWYHHHHHHHRNFTHFVPYPMKKQSQYYYRTPPHDDDQEKQLYECQYHQGCGCSTSRVGGQRMDGSCGCYNSAYRVGQRMGCGCQNVSRVGQRMGCSGCCNASVAGPHCGCGGGSSRVVGQRKVGGLQEGDYGFPKQTPNSCCGCPTSVSCHHRDKNSTDTYCHEPENPFHDKSCQEVGFIYPCDHPRQM